MEDYSSYYGKKPVPKWVLEQHGFTTQRQFKSHFRKKLAVLERAVMDFVSYSAYIPKDAWLKTLDISSMVYNIKEEMSQKNWGR